MPIVPVEINNREFYGFLDSGAAEILGIEAEKGDKIEITIGDGSSIPTYLQKLEVKFAGKKFEASIGFSNRLGIGFNIIGRKDFFENFRICFDERNKAVEVF